MIVYKKFLFIFLLLFAFLLSFVQGQDIDNTVKLTGQILNEENGEPVPFVHIINADSRQGTASDMDGKFNLLIEEGDTLTFSAVGYENLIFVADESRLENGYVKILLFPAITQLDQVDVFAFKDAASLKRHILSMDLPAENNKKIHIPGAYDGPKKPVKPGLDFSNGIGFSGPISMIQNVFSKRAKEERKYHEVQQDYQKQKLIDAKFNRELVEEVTGLQDDDLDEFMVYCNQKISTDFIIASNDYQIILAVNKCYNEFVKK